jgi:hypothetical protein
MICTESIKSVLSRSTQRAPGGIEGAKEKSLFCVFHG